MIRSRFLSQSDRRELLACVKRQREDHGVARLCRLRVEIRAYIEATFGLRYSHSGAADLLYLIFQTFKHTANMHPKTAVVQQAMVYSLKNGPSNVLENNLSDTNRR